MRRIVRPLQVALSFLTILPIRAPRDWQADDLRRAVPAYPFVGLVLSALLAPIFLLEAGPLLQAVLFVVGLLLLTGALHFDGFCDMADAALPPTSQSKRFEILKDPRIGSFALAAGLGLLLIKVAAVAELVGSKNWLLILPAPVLARSWVVLAMAAFPVMDSSLLGRDARLPWRETVTPLVLGALTTLIFAKLFGLAILIAAALGLLVSAALGRMINTRMGGLGGDAYGAIVESTEAVVLLVLAIII